MNQNNAYANPSILIETDELEACLREDDLRIIDCDINMAPKPEGGYTVVSGRANWREAHIPNSVYVNIGGELSADHPRLHYMLPQAERFAEVMSRLGIGNNHRVVLYSRGPNFWATRLYLMFREFGFDNVRVLNGAWDKWQAEGRPITTEPVDWPAVAFIAQPPAGHFVDKETVQSALGDAQACVMNALSPAIHNGEKFHPPYGRPGHITGSVNVFFMSLIDPATNRFLEPESLRERFNEHDALDANRLVAYCGGGISATAVAFALHLLGRPDVVVYDGSLSEWGNDDSLPMSAGLAS